MVGRYDGLMPIPELLRHGDFGLGTLDHLDGELIVLDGKAYQARPDGTVSEVADDRSTPFAVVTPFDPETESSCRDLARLEDLEALLDKAPPGRKNRFVVTRVDGHFTAITLRSVGRQEPPYRPLAEVSRTQTVRTIHDLDGTLVGIHCPDWAGGLNVPGDHWHFLSRDHKTGGHVLDASIQEGQIRQDPCRTWEILLDPSEGFNRADLTQDLRNDLHRVERSRGEPDPKPDRERGTIPLTPHPPRPE